MLINSKIKLPGFEEVTVTMMEEMEGKLCIHVEKPVEPHSCPVCHTVTQKIHDYRIQKIKHLKMFERQTLLFYRRRRYVCPCGKRFAEMNTLVESIKIRSIKVVFTKRSIEKEFANLQGLYEP
ncbi:transposase [Peribacillus huizhouensis]|uniref:Transposase n=1 Tax=Peribacillus huizhouensis TaxID=1501239 RepID=A0ABR6CP70_9BACI|nr:transposase [Peribacillus huizhouensis]